MCLLCSPLKNKSNQAGFGKGPFFMMQNIRNREKPPQIPALHSSSPHPILLFSLPSSAFLLSPEHVSQPVSVNHHCQNSSCTEVSTELFFAEKTPLNVSEICRSIIGRRVSPIACLTAIPPLKAGDLVGHCRSCYLTAEWELADPEFFPSVEMNVGLDWFWSFWLWGHGFWPGSMSIF